MAACSCRPDAVEQHDFRRVRPTRSARPAHDPVADRHGGRSPIAEPVHLTSGNGGISLAISEAGTVHAVADQPIAGIAYHCPDILHDLSS